MTEPRPDDVINQAFFGWSHDAGKLALLSHSFPRLDEATRWLRRLEAHLRLEPVPDRDLPPHALSCLYFDDGFVAILRRVNAGYSTGRNNSHALIGSTAALGMPAALCLDSWTGWQDRPPSSSRMEPIRGTYIGAEEGADGQFRPLAERCEPELVVVLARLLDGPLDPLSIIGCPDENRLAMVWGLRKAADDYLRQRGLHRIWSFSTYEDRHDVNIQGLPKIVFLPAKQKDAAVVHRTIIELDRDSSPGPNMQLARSLVANLLHDTPTRVQEPVTQSAAAHTGTGAGVHNDGTFTAYAPAAQPWGEQQQESSTYGDSTYGDSAPGKPLHRDGALRHGQRQSQRAPSVDRDVAAVLHAKNVREFERELNFLGNRWPGPHREMLRAKLNVDVMDRASRFIDVSAREELLRLLLKAAYGDKFEDLNQPRALEHAMELSKNCMSREFAAMLSREGPPKAKPAILAAAAERPDLLRPKDSSIALIAQKYRLVRGSRYLPIVTIVLAVALLVAMFVLGYLVGRPASAQPPTSSGAVTTTASAAQSLSPNSAEAGQPSNHQTQPATSGRVTITPGNQQAVFAFLKDGDKYYPQSLCNQVENENGVWQCRKTKDLPSGTAGGPPVLVAILVPLGQVADLEKKPAGEPILGRQEGWGEDKDVSVS
jgi:hypothetical protein